MKKKLTLAALYLSFLMIVATPTFAAANNVLVDGTKNLLNDALKWILVLIPTSAAVAIGYHSWVKNGTEEPAEIAAKNKLIKKILVGMIIGECAAGIVTLVLSYYGVTASI